ncbi:FRG domain-containing protein [Halanaerobium congolense]|uniref:FRG domain-containing protein n=1 Tax=Halanaerobium congolense TaxID=54121 RepID=A0A4R8GMZ4_9FIRM|nr:FRG domain-containing protein [Halanaerobium congolense]TDX42937.1 FRG domain-containing protein [Halanaerobium congolense]
MTKKVIKLDKLKRTIALQQEYKERNKNVSTARRATMASKDVFPLGRNAREDLYADLFTNGSTVRYPHGIVVKYGMNSPIKTFYRGEAKDYSRKNNGSKCRSSLGRELAGLETEAERELEFFTAQLKIIAFSNMINELKHNLDWNYCDIFSYVIAQHYGIRTQYLDITDDLAVALFFACCKHMGNGKYQPVSKRDIRENDFGSHAVLYKRVDDLTINLKAEKKVKDVLPIGYQPFTRCYKQRGYFIDTMKLGDIVNYDLAADHGFEKLYFKRTPEFAAEIYELFDGGRELFHDRSMELLSGLIDEIKTGDSFSEDSFDKAYDNFGVIKSKDWWLTKLAAYGTEVGEPALELSDDLKTKIDDSWDIKEFVDQERLAIGGRMVYYPPD